MPCFQNLAFSFIAPHRQKPPGLLATHNLAGCTLPTPYHRSFNNSLITFLKIYYSFYIFVLF